MPDGVAIATFPTLAPETVESVERLVARAAAVDCFSALNESATLRLRHPRCAVVHRVATQQGLLVGYAQVESGPDHTTGALVVEPGRRRRGVGSALVRDMLAAGSPPLQLWAVGDTAAARGLAVQAGLRRSRELLIMTRPLTEPVAPPRLRPDTVIRAFAVGADEEAWLAVNARAFAQHPEQGRMSRADLDERMAEPWFDPEGFLVAMQAEAMIGFHWTKQHPDHLGEVYVLGVDPDAGGRGLGKELLAAGLAHLQRGGNTAVELYVEGEHAAAIGLYRGYGFAVSSRDVMYAQV